MLVNADKRILPVRLKTTSPTSIKWIVLFYYYNSAGEKKVYQRNYNLNKPPYVVNKVANTSKKIKDERLRDANALVVALQNKLKIKSFNVDTGIFDPEQEEIKLPTLLEYLKKWYKYQSTKVEPSTLLGYKTVINKIEEYLIKNNKQQLTLKDFNKQELQLLLDSRLTVSKSSYNAYLERFQTFYKDYLINFLGIININDNITIGISKYKIEETDKHEKYLDVNRAIEDITKYNYYLGFISKCIYYTLHRPATLVSLQFKQFDLDKAVINISATDTKNKNKQVLRISKHLLQDIKDYVKENKPQQNDYFFGHDEMVLNNNNRSKYEVKMFGKYQTPKYIFINTFKVFKNLKTTDTELFTELHTLYGFKHNGYIYFKEYTDKDGNKIKVEDLEIIKITGHRSVTTLKHYSRLYYNNIDAELFSHF